MEKITRSKLVEKLRNVKGTTFANLFYATVEGKSKTVNGEKLLTKKTEVLVTLNSDYQKKMNRLLEKQGDTIEFLPEKMKGKKLISSDCRVLLTDEKTESNIYIYATVENHIKPKTIWFDRQGKIFDYAREISKGKKLLAEYDTANKTNISIYSEDDILEKENQKIRNRIFKENNMIVVPSAIVCKTVGRGLINKENDVDVFTLNIENLTGINIKGEQYIVTDE